MPFRDYQEDTGFNSFNVAPQEEQQATPANWTMQGVGDTMDFANSLLNPAGAVQAYQRNAETINSGFRLRNDVANAISFLNKPKFEADPNFDLPAKLKSDGMWDGYRDNFLGVESQGEYNYVHQKIAQENADKSTLAAAGWGGVLAAMAGGIISPTALLPFVGEATGWAAVGRGIAMGAVGAALQQAPLAINQQTYDWKEGAQTVAGGAILGAVLGKAAGYLHGAGTVAERTDALAEKVLGPDKGMAPTPGEGAIPPTAPTIKPGEVSVPGEVPTKAEPTQVPGIARTPGAPPAAAGGLGTSGPISGSSLSAAAREQPNLGGYAPATLGAGDVTLPTSGPLGLNAADRSGLAQLGPGSRSITQTHSEQGRWIASQLTDGGGLHREIQDVSATDGGTVENNLKAHWGPVAEFTHQFDDAYGRYVLGKSVPFGPVRADFAQLNSGRKFMTKNEFRDAVGYSMQHGDVSEVPEVQELAEKARPIYKNLHDQAVEHGVIAAPQEGDLKGDISYLNRSYHIEAIERRLDEFQNILSAHFNEKMTASYQEEVRQLNTRQANTATQIEDMQRPADEVKAMHEDFQHQLRALNEATRGTSVEDAEVALSDARSEVLRLQQAKRDRSNTFDQADLDAAKQQVKDLREQGGAPLADTVNARNAIRKRINSLNKSTAAYTSRQAAKLSAIEAIDDASVGTLNRLARKGQFVLNKLDQATDEEFNKQVTDLREQFASAGQKFDAGEDRIAKLSENEFFSKQEQPEAGTAPADHLANAQTTQLGKQLKLTRIADELEHFETMDREQVRSLIKEGLDDAVEKTHDVEMRRGARQERLRQQAEALDPKIAEERIKALNKKVVERNQEFSEKYNPLTDNNFDPKAGTADFSRASNELASSVSAHITGAWNRLSGYDMMMQPRGAELARMLDIPSDKLVSHDGTSFLKHNIEEQMHEYVRTLAPDVEIAKKLGEFSRDKEMNPAFQKMKEEYETKYRAKMDELRAAGAPQAELDKAGKRMERQRDRLNDDIDVLLQRLRGERGVSSSPAGFANRAGRVIMNINAMVHLGSVVPASISDVAQPIMRYTLLNTFREGFVPYIQGFRDIEASGVARREMRLANVAVEGLLHSRSQDLFGVGDYMVRGSKFEKGLSWASSKLGMMALFDPWTDVMKQITASTANAKLMDAISQVHGGPTILRANKQSLKEANVYLAKVGINPENAAEIWREINAPGGSNTVNKQMWPNTSAWKSQKAIQSYRQALVGEADNTIITPGIDRPNIMDASILHRMIFQFKNFGIGSINKTLLANLQERDLKVLNGTLISLALGALSYYITAKATGGTAEKQMQNELASGNWQRFADEAINRSGLFGSLTNVQDILGSIPMTAPYVTFAGHQTARRNVNNLIGAVGGPTADLVKNSMVELGKLDKPNADIPHYFRKNFLPLQNHFLLRRALDQVGL